MTAFKRNSETGLIEGIEYKFNPNGTINWRAMINPQHLVIQRDKVEEVKQKYGENPDLTKVEDKYLLILLAGIKELAQIRGYSYVQQHVDFVGDYKAVVTCTIQFLGNYETSGQIVCFSDVASAATNTTAGFGQNYLESIAANRAFVRAVRNFLNINIVGQDEIAPQDKHAQNQDTTANSSLPSPSSMLEERCKELKYSFAKIKESATKKKEDFEADPSTWTDFNSLSNADIWTILGKLEGKK